jgi:hypothetical protein
MSASCAQIDSWNSVPCTATGNSNECRAPAKYSPSCCAASSSNFDGFSSNSSKGSRPSRSMESEVIALPSLAISMRPSGESMRFRNSGGLALRERVNMSPLYPDLGTRLWR